MRWKLEPSGVFVPQVTAVIGHGRSPEGKNWGEHIDGCDAVIRMWDHWWQPPEDYGIRYDRGVVASSGPQVKAFGLYNRKWPAIGWLWYLRRSADEQPDGMEIVDQARWREEALQRLGRSDPTSFNLTRGCAAACWAIEKAGQGGEVVLVGFDNLACGKCLPIDEAFSPAYLEYYDRAYLGWRQSWYSPGDTHCGSHRIDVERPLIEALAARHSVNLSFAEVKWPV